ncbi:phosphatidate cytidylyltransferase [Pusillimonas sp. ANT_WB101]|uniref:phosphatidate cytidylyltransferase n=1 Tax=Pusillimonas sp. ANT_WB101 TaxID=2597356 RepID=UPI0011ED2589|nr:phosphatidate cytidylyltransferase [Pusillimonas sp. ANT_WB101]KAA0910990.1 phosphatidate cytidylyltransferase [Pusillimonas sp. ANT_WB101]
MLKQRIITAIILLVILLGALLAASPWPLVLLLTLTAGCALFEWLRLTWLKTSGAMPAILGVLMGVAMLAVAYQWLAATPAPWALELRSGLNYWVIPGVAIIWVAAATAMVVRGQAQRKAHCVWLSLFGIFAVVAVWASLVQLYLLHGAWYLVSLLALIWFADIAAYFVGRAIGRHKLAPKVSPGKTWEGAVGGVVAATAWVLISAYWPGSFGATLALRWPVGIVILIAIGLAAISIVGDLFESLLKRRAGVKDSSQLLPGHGGVYDRIDALLPVAPLALLLTGLPI